MTDVKNPPIPPEPTITVPIGPHKGVFEIRLLEAIKKAKTVDVKVSPAMRQERDFEALSAYTDDFIIGRNGAGYSFTLILDRKEYFRSPPVWKSEEEVRSAMPAFIQYVKEMPLRKPLQESAG